MTTHSGEHLYPQFNEDLSHEIRLRNAQDVRDREIATLRRDLARARALLTDLRDEFDAAADNKLLPKTEMQVPYTEALASISPTAAHALRRRANEIRVVLGETEGGAP